MSEETKIPYYLQMAPIWAEEMMGKKIATRKRKRKKWEAHTIKTLHDYYIKRVLRDFAYEIIELERLRLKTKRLLKNKSK